MENSCLSDGLPDELYALDKLASLTITEASGACNGSGETFFDDKLIMKSMVNLTISVPTLSGTIPFVVGLYPSLQHLHLSSTHNPGASTISYLYGVVPSSFSQLHGLKSLRLENSNLNGFKEDQLNLSAGLEVFSIAGSGSFAMHVDPLLSIGSHLRYLDISDTPASFPTDSPHPFPRLEYFYARSSTYYWWTLGDRFWSLFPNIKRMAITNARVTGGITSTIGDLKHLQYLNLSGSPFRGTISPAIGNCTSLETLIIKKTNLKGPLPSTLCQLKTTLRHLEISNVKTGGSTIPKCFGELKLLETLKLSSNGLTQLIPSRLGHLPNLVHVHLDNNALKQSLPDFSSKFLHTFDVHNNQLITFPANIAAHATAIILSYNFFSGIIDQDVFNHSTNLAALDLSHNYFTGPLPRFSPGHVPLFLDLSRNSFTGSIPAEYCEVKYLELSFNKLQSMTDLLTHSDGCPRMQMLSVGDNSLSEDGSRLNFVNFSHLATLSLKQNRFEGQLPLLPRGLETLDASNNLFTTHQILEWRGSIDMDSLRHLDLSSNNFRFRAGTMIDFFGENLEYLSLANNDLSGVDFLPAGSRRALTVLDLTSTQLGPSMPLNELPNLVILKIGHNQLTGELDLGALLSATQLDISFNGFAFDASKFASMPLLISLTANNNQLYGTLVLGDMPNLQSANFSNNALDQTPDFTTIGASVQEAQLRVLDISNNPLPTIFPLSYSDSGLTRTASSARSLVSPDSVTCYGLSFWNQSTQFTYSEDLFGFVQCDCSEGYFGTPPDLCIKCPFAGTTNCTLNDAWITPGSFMFIVPNGTENATTPSDGAPSATEETSLPPHVIWVPSFGSSFPNFSSLVLQTESCFITTVQSLSRKSNCEGGLITSNYFVVPGFSFPQMLSTQCAQGSQGRLCSKCICDPHGIDSCWFQSGPQCVKCRRIFSLSLSLPILSVLVILSIAVLSIIMAIVLRRRRIQSRTSFAELSIFKRIFYRVMYLKTLGNLSILITFLQTLIAFTGWDATARLEFLNLLNGKSDGLGLRCVFPFLSDPLWSQLTELSVPFVASAIVAISVIIGGAVAKIKFNSKSSLKTPSSADNELDKLLSRHQKVPIVYPTMALLTSLVITVVKFLYFGTALSAHQYLFSVPQPYTGVKYIQSTPWMKLSEALPLILASIPAILIFDLIIPLSFIYICWRARNTFRQPSVRIYYGSLFENYSDNCFWWEIVGTLKKLAIAFTLKALPATDAIQSALIVSILSATALIQLSVSPWKRKIENVFDGLSSLLLIGSLLATRPGNLGHIDGVIWYMWTLSVLFVVASVGFLIWQSITGTTEYETLLVEFEERNLLNTHIQPTAENNITNSWSHLDDARADF